MAWNYVKAMAFVASGPKFIELLSGRFDFHFIAMLTVNTQLAFSGAGK